MNRRVTIRWTDTAVAALKALPAKVRQGLLAKADQLLTCDPREVHKPLTGPLQGYYRITYARYRAVYTVQEEVLADGTQVWHLIVVFIAAGIRKERSKDDIYRVAERLVRLLDDQGVTRPKKTPGGDRPSGR